MKTKFKGTLSLDAFKKLNVTVESDGIKVEKIEEKKTFKQPKLKTNYKKFKQPKEEMPHEQTI